MKFLKSVLALLVAPIILTACAPASLRGDAAAVIKAGRLEFSETPTLARHANAVNMLYFNPNNSLVFRSANGVEQQLSEANEKDARRAYAVLHSDGEALYALWRPKLIKAVEGVGTGGDKLLYARVSLDGGKSFGAVKRLNQDGGAFKPRIASNGNGDVYVVWTDERSGGILLDLYLNHSHDRGESWKKEDIKINGAESGTALDPSVVSDGERVHVSWMTRDKSGQFRLFVRSSEDRGEHWLPPVAGHTSLEQPATPTMVKVAGGLLLCWADVSAVRCTNSSDHGQSWSSSVAVEDTPGTAGVFLSADPKGRAHLLIVRMPPGDDKVRVNLFHAFSDNGMAFSSPQRLSGGEPFKSSTILPVLTFGDDGSALAVWVDMRYQRPTIAANYSRDGGKTWLEKDILLAGKAGRFEFFPTVSYAGGGNYSVAWQEAGRRDDATTVIDRTEYHPGAPGISLPPPNIARLKERVDAFWRLREAEKWGEVYDYMDPFFRETNSRAGYMRSQGSVKYYEHRLVGEPQVSGIRGAVAVAYVSEVPELMLGGKAVSVPKQEVEIQHEWLWVDGDWYQVFRDIMGGSVLPD